MNKLKYIISIVLIYCLSLCACISANAELTPDTYNTAVENLSAGDIIFPSEDFDINAAVSRAVGACLVARAIGDTYEYTEVQPVFDDVGKQHWAIAYIDQLYKAGIVNGVGEKIYEPDTDMTYEQFIKMLVCYMGLSELALTDGGYPDGYIRIAAEKGITCDMEFAAKDKITQGDALVMLYRAMIYNGYAFGGD